METITPEQQYRIKLIESIQYLMKSTDETFTELINLAMIGEFNEIDTEFEEGESVKFDIAYFRNCKDQNVQVLIKQLDDTNERIRWLVNVNGVRDEELDTKVANN